MTEHDPLQPISAGQQEVLERAIGSYEAALTADAARWLLGRGLTEETVRTHRLGVVADPIPAHMAYAGWIAIPYLVQGRPVRVRFRRPDWCDQHSNKYGQPTGEGLLTYGVDSIHAARDTLHVTEGEFDRLILLQAGFHAIGFPGASTFRGYHGRMLAGFNRVWVWGDPDQAGAEFSQKVVNRLPRSARAVQLRVGDVTDTFLAGGVKALHDLVKEE